MKAAADAGGITLIHCEDLATIECCTAMLAEHARDRARPLRREPARRIGDGRHRPRHRDVSGDPRPDVHRPPVVGARARRLRGRACGRPAALRRDPPALPAHVGGRYQDPDGALYVAQPPLRSDADREALWGGSSRRSIDTIASDHAPWTRELKLDPKLDVARARPGVAELDTMLPLLYTEGVATGRLSLERFVALTSTNAARLFGMYPRKGTIAVGSDADLVDLGDPRTADDSRRRFVLSRRAQRLRGSRADGLAAHHHPPRRGGVRRGPGARPRGQRPHRRARKSGAAPAAPAAPLIDRRRRAGLV